MKRSLIILFALVLILSFVFTGCSKDAGEPAKTNDKPSANDGPLVKYDKPIKIRTMLNSIDPTIKFEKGDSPEENVWTRAYKEELGIELEFMWTGNAEQGNERLNLAIASDDLPDIYAVNQLQFEQLAAKGKLADITSVYAKYAGDFILDVMKRPGSDQALKASTYNDKMYALPYFLNCTDDTKLTWIRYDWLQKLKLEEPKTFQDVMNIAEAFIAKDPDGDGVANTIGFPMHSGSLDGSGAGMATFLNSFHAYPTIWVKGEDGKLINGSVQADKMKAGLKMLNDLLKKKIIDKNFASLKSDENIMPLITGNKVGVIFGGLWDGWWPLGDMKKPDPKCEWRSYPILSADSTAASSQAQTINVMRLNVVNSKFKNPEALIKMANLCNEKMWKSTPEVFAKYGYDASGNNPWNLSPVYFEGPGKNQTLHKNTVEALKNGDVSKLNGEESLIYKWMVDYKDKGDLSRYGIWLSYGPDSSCAKMDYYLDNKLYMLNEFYGNPPQSMIDNSAILDRLFIDYSLKIINGEYPAEKYDEFVAEWYEQGGQQITDDVNAWYDKIKK